ncbi:MAG: SpoIIE family protein phosphatase [Actinobacteria bacterium]|nr:SpoIIE family protein phosphatase [Actinomycetota bacterium]
MARCAPAVVMLLAAGALHLVAPMAAAKPNAKERGLRAAAHAEHVPPGQQKKAVAQGPRAQAALVEGGADEPAVAQTSTKKTTKAARPAKAAAKAKPSKQPATPDAEPTSPIALAPARLIVPSAPSLSAAPPAASADRRRTAANSAAQPTRRVRARTSGTRRTAPAPATTGRPGVVLSAALAPPPALARVRPDARQNAGARQDAGARRVAGAAASPLTRTVVRVLEVVPLQLRVALGALAVLGLLLAGATGVQTLRRRRLERQRRLLLADVGVLQSALLPDLPERIGGARVSVAYRPADGLAAGGDFYDAFELPGGRTGVLVGDVAGHGRAVVPLTALVRYNVRAYLEAGLSPRAAVHVAGNVLVPHLGELQVTIVVAIFDPGTGRLTYACAGHAPPLVLASVTPPVTACSSPPIGAGAATGRRQTTIAFAPGAVACFHTDGLDEVPLRYGRLGREGVADELQAVAPQCDAGDLIAGVVRRSARQPDDMAACILTALPGGADGWSLRLEELEVDRAALSSGAAQRFLLACGVGGPCVGRALREADAVIGRDGAAVIEVRVGEALASVRVSPPPGVILPIGRRTAMPAAAAAA